MIPRQSASAPIAAGLSAQSALKIKRTPRLLPLPLPACPRALCPNAWPVHRRVLPPSSKRRRPCVNCSARVCRMRGPALSIAIFAPAYPPPGRWSPGSCCPRPFSFCSPEAARWPWVCRGFGTDAPRESRTNEKRVKYPKIPGLHSAWAWLCSPAPCAECEGRY